MKIEEWEDICISFDEYGMQPATLCDNDEEVINNFRKAFREVLKDLREKEFLENDLKLEKYKVKYLMKQLKKQDEILDILKQRVHLKKSFLDENNILFIQSTGFVFENDKEHIILKEWLEK